METLTADQLAAKILYLERENAQLRSQNLDLQVRAGIIRLAPPATETAAEMPAGRSEDG